MAAKASLPQMSRKRLAVDAIDRRPLVHVDLVESAEDVETVRGLLREYAASLPIDLEYQDFSAELASLPGAYRPPDGRLFIARVDRANAGCVAFRRVDARICEMKRLYVGPDHRGLGAGHVLVDTAIVAARSIGYEEMWLDTLPSMQAAQRLYVSRGFREIPRYGGLAAPGTRYYGVRLVLS